MPETKPGRVHVAQQPVTDGSFVLISWSSSGTSNSGRDTASSILIELAGTSCVVIISGRRGAGTNPGIKEPLIAGGHKLGLVLDFFRPHAAAPEAMLFYQ